MKYIQKFLPKMARNLLYIRASTNGKSTSVTYAPEDTLRIKKMCNDMRKSSFLRPYSDPPGLRKFSDTISALFSMMPIMGIIHEILAEKPVNNILKH